MLANEIPARFSGSRDQHLRARTTLARGVATAFRAGQLPLPLSFERGIESRIWDIDGNEYLDYVLAFGPLLLGHSPASVLDAVSAQLGRSLGFGASHRSEAELSEIVVSLVPSAELCVFNTTGSEAVHSAIRIARAATGRSKIVKFLGHYHGWFDSVHVGVPPASDAVPGTQGQDGRAFDSTVVVPWDDVEALRRALSDADVAAVLMEPIAVNGGCFTPSPGYLEAVRRLTRDSGVVLIFDEVITGFRVALGGAQERLGVIPDLTVLGKALGAGFPISAVCGRADLMEEVVTGRVAHVGTFNLNPVGAAAAIAALTYLRENADSVYTRLERQANALAAAFVEAGTTSGMPLAANTAPGVAQLFAASPPIRTYGAALRDADTAAAHCLAGALVENGVHIIPKGLLYVSTAHSDEDIAETSERLARAVAVAASRCSDGIAT